MTEPARKKIHLEDLKMKRVNFAQPFKNFKANFTLFFLTFIRQYNREEADTALHSLILNYNLFYIKRLGQAYTIKQS